MKFVFSNFFQTIFYKGELPDISSLKNDEATKVKVRPLLCGCPAPYANWFCPNYVHSILDNFSHDKLCIKSENDIHATNRNDKHTSEDNSDLVEEIVETVLKIEEDSQNILEDEKELEPKIISMIDFYNASLPTNNSVDIETNVTSITPDDELTKNLIFDEMMIDSKLNEILE